MAEAWRQVPGFEGFYEVSDLGRVKSLQRWSNGRILQERILAHVDDGKGYPKVVLRAQDRFATVKVHRLVCRVFHGEPAPGMQAHHIDNDRWNAAASNLAWVSASDNSFAKAGSQSGERHPRAKLTDKQVEAIRGRAADGESGRAIARSLGLSYSHVNRLIRGVRRAEGLAQNTPES